MTVCIRSTSGWLLCMVAVTPCFGQVVQFDDTTNRWHVVETFGDPFGFIEHWTDVWGNMGDTLILGEPWAKAYLLIDGEFGTDSVFHGYVRHEGDMVLFTPDGSMPDTLYDFDLLPGDSTRYSFLGDPFPGYLHVNLVDTVQIGGIDHRRIHFDQYDSGFCYLADEHWIEGVGSIRGPLFPAMAMGFCEEFAESMTLSCFGQVDTVVWMDTAFAECVVNILLGVEETVDGSPGTTIVQEFLWLPKDLDGNGLRIEVVNASGQRIIDRSVIPSRPVDVSDLPQGLYVYFLSGPDRSLFAGRFVKVP